MVRDRDNIWVLKLKKQCTPSANIVCKVKLTILNVNKMRQTFLEMHIVDSEMDSRSNIIEENSFVGTLIHTIIIQCLKWHVLYYVVLLVIFNDVGPVSYFEVSVEISSNTEKIIKISQLPIVYRILENSNLHLGTWVVPNTSNSEFKVFIQFFVQITKDQNNLKFCGYQLNSNYLRQVLQLKLFRPTDMILKHKSSIPKKLSLFDFILGIIFDLLVV